MGESMQLCPNPILSLVFCGALLGCKDDPEKRTSQPRESNQQGALILGEVAGKIEPKEGADSSSVIGAKISAIGRPEVKGTTDTNGEFKLSNIAPGALEIMIISDASSALRLEGSAQAKYGLKFDEVLVTSGESTDLGIHSLKETGSIKGSVGFYINENNLDLTGSDVFIPGTGYIVKTDSAGAFSMTGLPPGKYSLRLQHTGYAALDLKDVEVLEGQATELGSQLLSLSNGPEGGIQVQATMEASILGVTRKIVRSLTAQLNLNYDSDASLMKLSEDPSFINRQWKPVSATDSWSFEDDGFKSIYVKFSDLNGLESSPYKVDFYVDTEAPVLSSVVALYGWEQTAQREIFLDLVASDSGSGVAEVAFVNDSNDFVGATWSSYATNKDVTLSSGSGTKTIYVKVRDYAGNESTVVSDEIILGATTLIRNRTYSEEEIILRAAQSPFFAAGVSMNSNLVIEPGVELRIGASFSALGTVTAVGTTAKPIKIKTDGAPSAGASCSGSSWGSLLVLNSAPAGVSVNNVFERVEFEFIEKIRVNGGQFKLDTFNNSACTVNSGGGIVKTGFEDLSVTHSTFSKYGTAINAQQGTGHTTFSNNSGSVYQNVIYQSSSATGTKFSNNQFTVSRSDGCFLQVSTGTISQAENSANALSETSSGYMLCLDYGAGTVVIDGFTMTSGSGAIIIPDQSSNLTATIKNSSLTGISRGVYIPVEGGGGYTINLSFQNSIITVSEALTQSHQQSNYFVLVESFTGNTITCATASGVCDLVHSHFDGDTYLSHSYTFTGNTINCSSSGGNGCRGFYVNSTSPAGGAGSVPISLTTASNTWSGKSPIANLSSEVKDQTAIFDDSYIYLYRDDTGGVGETVVTWSISQ